MATFIRVTRAVGNAKGQVKFVNMDLVTDFARDRGRDATALYFKIQPDATGEADRPWALLVQETPEEIMEAVRNG